MPKAGAPPGLTLRHHTWFARLTVPKDVRPVIGRNIFIQSTHERDPGRAYVIAAPWLTAWKLRIDEARRTKADPAKAQIEKLAYEYRRLKAVGDLDGAAHHLVFDVVAFVFERMGGMTPDQRRNALIDARGDVAKAMRTLPSYKMAAAAYAHITGSFTPFLFHFEQWKASTHLQGAACSQAVREIKEFAGAVPEPIELLGGKHVRDWTDGLLRPKGSTKKMKPGSVRHKLASLRSYWEWMQDRDLVKKDVMPFNNIRLLDGKNGAERAGERRTRFAPHEVVMLWRTAEERGHKQLAAVIKIAAYTGIRREGICSLNMKSVRTDFESGVCYLHVSEKSEAGVRDVPIHSKIADLIDTLLRNADANGYLIHATPDRFGVRGIGIGNQFSKFKTSLGFDQRYVFHSLRHTVAYLLKKNGGDLSVSKNLLGHTDKDITTGRYGGTAEFTVKKSTVELIYYPD